MASITTKEEFKAYILRALGAPVIKINVDDSQVDDAVDTAVDKFTEQHRDGYEECYYIHEVDETDVLNGYFVVPERITDVIELIPLGVGLSSLNFSTVEWQMMSKLMSTYNSYVSVGILDYTTAVQSVYNINSAIGNYNKPFSYTKWTQSLYPRFKFGVGHIVTFRAYGKIDPRVEGCERAWNDFWLKEYATALVKEKWGSIMSKADGIRLPGGVTLNGKDKYEEAKQDIERLEQQLQSAHELPPDFSVG